MSEQCAGTEGYFRYHVFCCVNERAEGNTRGCCRRKGGLDLRNYMKAQAKRMGLHGVRINSAGCLDRCELGPTLVVYPEGIWYRAETYADIDEILAGHLREGKPVERLILRNEASTATK